MSSTETQRRKPGPAKKFSAQVVRIGGFAEPEDRDLFLAVGGSAWLREKLAEERRKLAAQGAQGAAEHDKP